MHPGFNFTSIEQLSVRIHRRRAENFLVRNMPVPLAGISAISWAFGQLQQDRRNGQGHDKIEILLGRLITHAYRIFRDEEPTAPVADQCAFEFFAHLGERGCSPDIACDAFKEIVQKARLDTERMTDARLPTKLDLHDIDLMRLRSDDELKTLSELAKLFRGNPAHNKGDRKRLEHYLEQAENWCQAMLAQADPEPAPASEPLHYKDPHPEFTARALGLLAMKDQPGIDRESYEAQVKQVCGDLLDITRGYKLPKEAQRALVAEYAAIRSTERKLSFELAQNRRQR